MTNVPPMADSLRYAPIATVDLPFIVSTFVQSYMRSPGMPAPTSDLKHQLAPTVMAVLNRPDVWILGAFGEFDNRPDAIIGWLAWSPPSEANPIPALHYAYVRGPWRKRGVFNRMLAESMIGRRWLFTFKGTVKKYDRRGPSKDKILTEALNRRGVYPTFVPVSQWLERTR